MHRHKMVDHTTDSYIQAHQQCFHLEPKLLDSYFSSTERFSVNSQVSKKLKQADLPSFKLVLCNQGYNLVTRKLHVIRPIGLAVAIPRTFEPSMVDGK